MSDRGATSEGPRLSRAAAHRLSLYLRCLTAWPSEVEKISSSQIAAAVGVTDAQVRRDLAALGHLGQRGIGYDPRELTTVIREALGTHRPWRVVLVGVGNLGRALLRYQGFRSQGFEIVALFDNHPAKVGESVEGLLVRPLSDLPTAIHQEGAELAILTVPREAAQSVADCLVQSGIRGILNFAPVVLRLPPHVPLVTVDLAIQLEQLTFLVQHAHEAISPSLDE
jgi:redox-sensing transcriptional repressor